MGDQIIHALLVEASSLPSKKGKLFVFPVEYRSFLHYAVR